MPRPQMGGAVVDIGTYCSLICPPLSVPLSRPPLRCNVGVATSSRCQHACTSFGECISQTPKEGGAETNPTSESKCGMGRSEERVFVWHVGNEPQCHVGWECAPVPCGLSQLIFVLKEHNRRQKEAEVSRKKEQKKAELAQK